MKTKNLVLVLCFFALLNSGCSFVTRSDQSPEKTSQSRVVVKEYTVINGNGYIIVKVDSIEFLAVNGSGVVRLSK